MIGKRGATIKSWQLTMNAVSHSGAMIKNACCPSLGAGISDKMSLVTVAGIYLVSTLKDSAPVKGDLNLYSSGGIHWYNFVFIEFLIESQDV